MKIVHNAFENFISISGNKPNVLVIENPVCFRTFIRDLILRVEGEDSDLFISLNDVELNYKRDIFIIDNPVELDDNLRTIWTPIIKDLGVIALEDKHYSNTIELFNTLEDWIEELILSSDYPISFEKELSPDQFLKAFKFHSLISYSENLVEAFLDYIQLIDSVLKPKLFIFRHLKSYFGEKELRLIYKKLTDDQITILNIESVDFHCEGENRTIVDQDNCTI